MDYSAALILADDRPLGLSTAMAAVPAEAVAYRVHEGVPRVKLYVEPLLQYGFDLVGLFTHVTIAPL
jgi:hypothetical protein